MEITYWIFIFHHCFPVDRAVRRIQIGGAKRVSSNIFIMISGQIDDFNDSEWTLDDHMLGDGFSVGVSWWQQKVNKLSSYTNAKKLNSNYNRISNERNSGF